MKHPDWHFECDTAVFERIKSELSFQQILARARAVNGLQFVISALVKDTQDFSPMASRSRINSFLFGSAILYEGLLLVEKMNREFMSNETFTQGLQTLLKDPAARALRQSHMGPARNFAVFYYDPEEFGRIVRSASVDDCEFMTGRGKLSRESYFPFADTLAAELLMGTASSCEDFYENLGSVMSETKGTGPAIRPVLRVVNFKVLIRVGIHSQTALLKAADCPLSVREQGAKRGKTKQQRNQVL